MDPYDIVASKNILYDLKSLFYKVKKKELIKDTVNRSVLTYLTDKKNL